MSDKAVRLISTFLYVGKFPLAPGSLASFVGVLMAMALAQHPMIYILIWGLVTFLGFRFSGRMEGIVQEKDPSCIVIDEVSGCLLAFFLLPLTPSVLWTTFFLFRAFDMFKIYPVNKLEAMPGSIGIMADDLLAGVYTNLIMQIAVRWAGMI